MLHFLHLNLYPLSGPLVTPRFVEGNLGLPSFNGSFSSRSDGSEYDATSKSHGSAGCSFSNHRFFMPKAIHPLSVPDHVVGGEEQRKPGAILQKEPVVWDNTDNFFMDICELLEPKARPANSSLHDSSRCGLCERLLSQRSPWCSCRIVCSGDLPTASVLSCRHVYHSECLEQTTPKVYKHDPPCPLCSKSDENISDRRAVCRMRNGIPKLKSPEEGPSRLWSCAQAGDCVEGVLHAPKQSRMVLLSKNHLKRQLSMKVNLSKKQSENLKRSGIQRQVGCSSSS